MRKLWGGRFEGATDALIEQLNNSLTFDRRLWRQDIAGSIAHAEMLGAAGIIPVDESAALVAGLRSIEDDLTGGRVALPDDAEDVHTAIEGMLRERLGPVAGKLHTARSRNDQVATDIRLYLREACDDVLEALRSLEQALLDIADREMESILPGYTHLQHAQPIVLAHHLLAYFWMFDRDRERIADCRQRVNRMPLGAGALAGTGFAIDREMVARALGFDEILENSLDAVADRDFIVEFIAAGAMTMCHMSRLAEELIIWNSFEFGFVTLDDAVTTGSSIMPQKKNPDVAELARGKTGRIYGDLMAILTVMKGLPLAYNKDMQEDKEPLFDTVDTLLAVIPTMKRTIETARFRSDRMIAATRGDYSTATDLADFLVRQGVPFREAHDLVGAIVRHCTETGAFLEDLDAERLARFSPLLASPGAASVLSVESSVTSRRSHGGTAPSAVRIQWKRAADRLNGDTMKPR